jgi:hypothetical protein
LWSMMDINLKQHTTFHSPTNGKTKDVNWTLVQLLKGYTLNHPRMWHKTIPYISNTIMIKLFISLHNNGNFRIAWNFSNKLYMISLLTKVTIKGKLRKS